MSRNTTAGRAMSLPLYRDALVDLNRSFKLWVPQRIVGPKHSSRGGRKRSNATLKQLATVILDKPTYVSQREIEHGAVYESNRRTTAYRYGESPSAREDGLSATEATLDTTALARWMDQQQNPDDYEPEVSSCEDCGEPVVFDMNGWGTISEWCPNCGVIRAGARFQPTHRPASGAFGAARPVTRRRRFWSIPKHVSVVTRFAHRIFLPVEQTPVAIASPFKKRPPTGKHAALVEFACRGQPFVAPVPLGMEPKKYANTVRCMLMQNKHTMLGKWAVSVLPEGVRVGLVGTWKDADWQAVHSTTRAERGA